MRVFNVKKLLLKSNDYKTSQQGHLCLPITGPWLAVCAGKCVP